jgi:hypothetical protein
MIKQNRTGEEMYSDALDSLISCFSTFKANKRLDISGAFEVNTSLKTLLKFIESSSKGSHTRVNLQLLRETSQSLALLLSLIIEGPFLTTVVATSQEDTETDLDSMIYQELRSSVPRIKRLIAYIEK